MAMRWNKYKIIQTCESASTHQLAILRDYLTLAQKGTQNFVGFLKKKMKDKCPRCLFKIKGVKHKTRFAQILHSDNSEIHLIF